MEVRVLYQGRTRIVKASNADRLVAQAKTEFGIAEQVFVEQFNDNWKSWVEIDIDVIKDMCTIRLVPQSTLIVDEDNIRYLDIRSPICSLHSSPHCLDDEPADIDPLAMPGSSTCSLQMSPQCHDDEPADIDPLDIHGSSSCSLQMSPQCHDDEPADVGPPAVLGGDALKSGVSTRSKEEAPSNVWVTVQARVSQSCRQALKGTRKISQRHWSELIRCWYSVVVEKSFYPRRGDYRRWAMDLIHTFGESVCSHSTLMGSINSIRTRMRAKMKNGRYRNGGEQLWDERVQKKMRTNAEGGKSAPLRTFHPGNRVTPKDDKRKAYLLKNSYSDLKQDDQNALKRETFRFRRSLISSSTSTVKQLRDIFPWLLDEDEIWREFEMICGDDRRSMANSRLDTVLAAVSRTTATPSDDEETLQALLSLFGVEGGLDGASSAGICVLHQHLAVNGENICPLTPGPGQLLSWTIAHTVFSVAPLPMYKHLTLFVRDFCLGVKEGKRPKEVSTVMKSLGLSSSCSLQMSPQCHDDEPADVGPPAVLGGDALKSDVSTRSKEEAPSNVWVAVQARVSQSCRQALKGTRQISQRHWSELFRCWYSVVVEKSYYPHRGDYMRWATELIDTFGESVCSKPTLLNSIIFGGRDRAQEAKVQQWIEIVTGEKWPQGVDYCEYLRDGVTLCKLMNKLSPGSIKRIKATGSAFNHMDNLHSFLDAMLAYGCAEVDLFEGSDLLQNRNVESVTRAVLALGRQAHRHSEWKGPLLGPKPADHNVRQFDASIIAAGNAVIGMQAGYNKGASQAGQSFGKPRRIIIGK